MPRANHCVCLMKRTILISGGIEEDMIDEDRGILKMCCCWGAACVGRDDIAFLDQRGGWAIMVQVVGNSSHPR